MSVSPQEPAAAGERSEALSAAPVPVNGVRSPLTVTAALLGALGVLLLGYWAGYSVAIGAMDEAVASVAEASEQAVAVSVEPVEATVEPSEPEKVQIDAPDLVARPRPGLHLQVSASKSPSAASQLQRRLESHGFPVRVDAASNDSLVRVYVGPIADKAELPALTDALRKEGLEPFPKRL